MQDLKGSTPAQVALAGKTLQWLVKFAEARQSVTYGELSKLIGVNWRTVLPRLLGNIGHTLEELSSDIPPIQLLVANKKVGIPGRSGLLGFLLKDKALMDRLSLEDKRHQWELMKEKVFDWDWRAVLKQFGLEPISIASLPIEEAEKEVAAICAKQGGGEGEDHRRLKEYVAAHPNVIGLNFTGVGLTEQTLLSGDRLDVLFALPDQWVCVEIKGKHSPEADILRGIFQCVKYKAILEAQRHYGKGGSKLTSIRVVLVLATELPASLEPIRAILGVEVKMNVKVPEHVVATAK